MAFQADDVSRCGMCNKVFRHRHGLMVHQIMSNPCVEKIPLVPEINKRCHQCLRTKTFTIWPPMVWTLKNAWMYQQGIIPRMRTVLLIRNRDNTPFCSMPRDVVYIIFRHLARMDTAKTKRVFAKYCDECKKRHARRINTQKKFFQPLVDRYTLEYSEN
jgi:hypothetical protein